jgi:hypothetical protein
MPPICRMHENGCEFAPEEQVSVNVFGDGPAAPESGRYDRNRLTPDATAQQHNQTMKASCHQTSIITLTCTDPCVWRRVVTAFRVRDGHRGRCGGYFVDRRRGPERVGPENRCAGSRGVCRAVSARTRASASRVKVTESHDGRDRLPQSRPVKFSVDRHSMSRLCAGVRHANSCAAAVVDGCDRKTGADRSIADGRAPTRDRW